MPQIEAAFVQMNIQMHLFPGCSTPPEGVLCLHGSLITPLYSVMACYWINAMLQIALKP